MTYDVHKFKEVGKMSRPEIMSQCRGQDRKPRRQLLSELMRGRSGMFSASRLMEFLTALDQDVEITVRPKRNSEGKISVSLPQS